MSLDAAVSGHYTLGGLGEKILAALEQTGVKRDAITVDDLAPVDEFHIGGRHATEDLAARLDITADKHLLDLGSGIGGAARFIATRYGCRITGIDLTPEYCEVATMLTARVGLSERIDFRQGNALSLPFDEAAFDGAYSMHVGMNIPDKTGYLGELRRVVRPNGLIGIYDVMQGPGGDPQFPLPWAEGSATSFLVPIDALRAAIADAGLEVVEATDRSAAAIAAMKAMREKAAGAAPPPLGIHLAMGEGAGVKLANMARNLQEGRIAPWRILCRVPG
jgi:ubiquinone/menaquinone biosynthesis C-methylase UbiE